MRARLAARQVRTAAGSSAAGAPAGTALPCLVASLGRRRTRPPHPSRLPPAHRRPRCRRCRALEVFAGMQRQAGAGAGAAAPNAVTYNTLISACAKAGRYARAQALHADMVAAGIPGDAFTLTALITGALRAEVLVVLAGREEDCGGSMARGCCTPRHPPCTLPVLPLRPPPSHTLPPPPPPPPQPASASGTGRAPRTTSLRYRPRACSPTRSSTTDSSRHWAAAGSGSARCMPSTQCNTRPARPRALEAPASAAPLPPAGGCAAAAVAVAGAGAAAVVSLVAWRAAS